MSWASPAWQPGEAASGDRVQHCLLVLAAGSSLSRVPGRPHPVPELLGHQVPVAAAHQAGAVDLIAAAGYGHRPGDSGKPVGCPPGPRPRPPGNAATAWPWASWLVMVHRLAYPANDGNATGCG
jgi:hypothetical protein